MKKILILIIILFITGCSYTELNNLSIINSIGIEKRNNEYIMYANIIDSIKEKNDIKTTTLTIKSNNINNLFQELINKSNKKIHYSHLNLLILDNNLNNNDLSALFNYFLNNNNFRNDFSVIGSDNINNLLEKTKYNEINTFIKNNNNSNFIKIDIESIIKNYLDNKYFFISFIEYNNNLNYLNNRKMGD